MILLIRPQVSMASIRNNYTQVSYLITIYSGAVDALLLIHTIDSMLYTRFVYHLCKVGYS